MRVLVTGGAGFLGSHLVDRLLAEHHDVDVVDDLSTGSLSNLAAARAVAAGALHVHTFDVRAPSLVELFARRRPEVVFNLVGARADAAARDRVELVLVGTVNLLEAARSCGASKVVVGLDAMGLYGEVPSKELPIREGQPFQPTTLGGVADRSRRRAARPVPRRARAGVHRAGPVERVRVAAGAGGRRRRRHPRRRRRGQAGAAAGRSARAPATCSTSTTRSTPSCAPAAGGAASW